MEHYYKYIIRYFVLLIVYSVLVTMLIVLYPSVWSVIICLLMTPLFRTFLIVWTDKSFFSILANELDAKKFYSAIYEKLTCFTNRYRLSAELCVGNYQTVIAMASAGFSNTKSFRRKCTYLAYLSRVFFELRDDDNLAKTVDCFNKLQKENKLKRRMFLLYQEVEYYKAYLNKDYEQCIYLTEMHMKKIRKNSVIGKLQWLVSQRNLAIAYYEFGNVDKAKEIFQWFVENTPKFDSFYNISIKYLEAIESGNAPIPVLLTPDENEIIKYKNEFFSIEKNERIRKTVAIIFLVFAIVINIYNDYTKHTKAEYEAKIDAAVSEKYNNGRQLKFFNIEKDGEKVASLCLVDVDYELILTEIVSYDEGETLSILEIAKNIDFNTRYDKGPIGDYYIGFMVLSDKPSNEILNCSLEFEFIDNTYWLYVYYLEAKPLN